MKRLIFVSLGALALTGCMGKHLKSLAVCDGKHRRPANVYGSILPVLPVPVPPSEAGAPSPDSVVPVPSGPSIRGAHPAPAASSRKTSLRERPTHYASC